MTDAGTVTRNDKEQVFRVLSRQQVILLLLGMIGFGGLLAGSSVLVYAIVGLLTGSSIAFGIFNVRSLRRRKAWRAANGEESGGVAHD